MIYITIGLALTTIAIEVASDYVQKLHHIGRPVENTGNTQIWFGGKKITVNNLMKNVGEKYGIKELENPSMMPNLMDTIVTSAIEKNENPDFELPKLRDPTPIPTPTPPPRAPTPDPIVDTEEKIECKFELAHSESNKNLATPQGKPDVLTPTGNRAIEQVECVPLMLVDLIASDDENDEPFEYATIVPVNDELLNDIVINEQSDALFSYFPPVYMHNEPPQIQELPPPTPPPSPPKPKRRSPRPKPKRQAVDFSLVNDPKERYELYQKEWERYNAHLLQAKQLKEQKAALAQHQTSNERLYHQDYEAGSSHGDGSHQGGSGSAHGSSLSPTSSRTSPILSPRSEVGGFNPPAKHSEISPPHEKPSSHQQMPTPASSTQPNVKVTTPSPSGSDNHKPPPATLKVTGGTGPTPDHKTAAGARSPRVEHKTLPGSSKTADKPPASGSKSTAGAGKTPANTKTAGGAAKRGGKTPSKSPRPSVSKSPRGSITSTRTTKR